MRSLSAPVQELEVVYVFFPGSQRLLFTKNNSIDDARQWTGSGCLSD